MKTASRLAVAVGPEAGGEEDYWRALFGLDGRFVSVSLVGLDGQPIESFDGFETLTAQVERIRTANTR